MTFKYEAIIFGKIFAVQYLYSLVDGLNVPVEELCWCYCFSLSFLLHILFFCIFFLCCTLKPRFSFTITCTAVEMLTNRGVQSASHVCFFTFFSEFVVCSNTGIAWYLVEYSVCEASNIQLGKCSSAPERFVFLFINMPKALLCEKIYKSIFLYT